MIAVDLGAIYPAPDPFASEAQLDRFENRDLAGLTDHDLQRELVVLRLVNFATDGEWHRGRELRVIEELARRGNNL